MQRTQEVYYGETGQIVHYDADLRPSSPTVTVHENTAADATSVAAIGAVTVDAVDTTVSATSGLGQTDPRKINLTSTANVTVGLRYLVTSTLGVRARVEVLAIGSGYVLARHPLGLELLATSTFQGLRISAVVEDAWAASSANVTATLSPVPRFRMRVAYTAGGASVVRSAYLDLVRYPAAHAVVGSDVDAMFPGWLDHLPAYYRADDGAALINAAFDSVRFDLRAGLRAPHMARDAEALDMLTVLKSNALAQEWRLQHGAGTGEAAVAARAGYQDLLDVLLRQIPWDATGTGAAATAVDRSAAPKER